MSEPTIQGLAYGVDESDWETFQVIQYIRYSDGTTDAAEYAVVSAFGEWNPDMRLSLTGEDGEACRSPAMARVDAAHMIQVLNSAAVSWGKFDGSLLD